MHIDGTGANHLAILWDSRSKADAMDDCVFPSWTVGRMALGRKEWERTLRIALREPDDSPWTANVVKAERDSVLRVLRERRIRAVVPVQSPSLAGERQVHSAWNLIGHSGNPYKWAGTVQMRDPFFVCPILNPSNYEHVYSWLIARWLKQAWAVAQGRLLPMKWPELVTLPLASVARHLSALAQARAPIAVDIETNMAGTIITAIGVANADIAISLPWHGYEISGRAGEREEALLDYPCGEELRDQMRAFLENPGIPKILHNGAFDVLELAKHGINLAAFEFDTLLMHRVVYPQYRHGLQQACATELCVEPWKALFKTPKVPNGEDPWLGCPVALREYNAKDAASTWALWNCLKGKLG